jgi:hypothetical protein
MLKSISWQEYFYWLLLLGGGYYCFIVAVFYSKDIFLKFKRIRYPEQPATKAKPESSGGMMGSIRQTLSIDKRRGPATVQSEEISVETKANQQPEEDLSPTTELLQEFRALCQIMQEGGATQNDYIKNIKTALSRYGHFVGTAHEGELTTVISNELNSIQQISVTEADIKQLWPHELNNSINNHK